MVRRARGGIASVRRSRAGGGRLSAARALGRLLLDGRLVAGCVEWNGERIRAVRTDLAAEELARAQAGPLIAPGLIDLHVHGYGGSDPIEQLPEMARALARHGTTAFQPTLFPAAPAEFGALAERVTASAARLDDGARVVGLHLEGPFVNPASAGALPLAALAAPSPAALRELLGPAGGSGRGIRTITLAPELPHALELVAELARCGIRASLGHSLATADEARAAAKAGASGATHLYNAMRPFHHREAGLVGFALSADALYAELIGDLVHVGRDAIDLALAARGPRAICLVSDALRGAGTGCERFHSHGREHIAQGGAFFYAGEPPKLAGSALGQLEQVQKLVARGVVGIEDALTMASLAPALALGIERECGQLAVGARADLIALRGPELALEAVWIGGHPQAL
ncbi:MAG: N-acetylglucosamine-6-phosphate deacetylase [Planctomycetota bacterium]|nr:MAG: N-acetylglucosamine-6-phosphate deacetylase [Planctomycetota bacterium]